MNEKHLQYKLDLDPRSKWIVVEHVSTMDALDMQVQEMGDMYHKGTSRTERFGLESYLIVLTLAGSGEITFCQKTHQLKPGLVTFLDCRERYCTIDHPGSRQLFIHFNSKIAAFYHKQFNEMNGGLPSVEVRNLKGIEDILLSLLDIFSGRQIRQSDCVSAYEKIIQMMTQLLLQFDAPRETKTVSSIESVVEYIRTNYTEEINLDMLAKRAFMSKYYFLRLFRDNMGYTPVEYLTMVRINKAKQLLRKTDLSVKEIGKLVGVSSNSYFIKLFENREEMTPGRYRKTWGGHDTSQ